VKTETVSAGSPDALRRAVDLLRAGETVALPTETVYGLAADALNIDAALKIFEAKERPRFDPLIVHLPSRDWLPRLTSVGATEEKLIDEFWPGPLTLVLPRKSIVPDIVTAGLETVALRMSAHPVFREIIGGFGGPLAAPSANRFGHISPTAAEHVAAELDERIPLIVDGGPTTHGLESTIVAVRNNAIEVLRPGPVTEEQLGRYAEVRCVSSGARPEAPGQLPTHYAPRTPLVLTKDAARFRSEGKKIAILTLPNDLREAAANLFRRLRELDESGVDLIVAEEVAEIGLGRAIMDRLRRAAVR
jgi:L-threonylcarbamoyladenylate synthase